MKITIGIPTIAGRTRYLAAALETCLAQDDPDFEVIVSDNSPGDARAVVERIGDPRIRYIQPDTYLPMSAHWDFMVSHFTGDMVIVIGDDDGLMPGALRHVRALVAAHGLKPVRPALVQYAWPDFPDQALRDKFWFVHEPGPAAKLSSSRDFLMDLCRARARYIDGPGIYHSFIPRSVLERLPRDGSVFHRSSPDIYTAITIAAHTDQFIVTGQVLTVAGVSAKSNGYAMRDGNAASKRVVEEMQAQRYLPRYRSLTVQMHTVDSILEASERYDLPELRSWVDLRAHFCAAANECLDMPNRRRRTEQMLLLLREARQGGCLGYLLRNRGAKLAQKAWQRLTGGRSVAPPSGGAYVTEVKRAMPGEVGDVRAASLHLQQLLAQRPA